MNENTWFQNILRWCVLILKEIVIFADIFLWTKTFFAVSVDLELKSVIIKIKPVIQLLKIFLTLGK
jgi:hypothetical protein